MSLLEVHIPYFSIKYLGHNITEGFSNGGDIAKQRRSIYAQNNIYNIKIIIPHI